jgi:hypothetical protein
VLLSAFVVHRLDDNYEAHANNPRLESARAQLASEYEAFQERRGHGAGHDEER